MFLHFLTATAAARHMRKNGSGVILALTAQAVRKPYPNVGGFGVAGAAIEGLCRQLAVELGPQGIHVICLRSGGSPDTPGVDEVFRHHAENAGISCEEFEASIAEKHSASLHTLLARPPSRCLRSTPSRRLAVERKAPAWTAVMQHVDFAMISFC